MRAPGGGRETIRAKKLRPNEMSLLEIASKKSRLIRQRLFPVVAADRLEFRSEIEEASRCVSPHWLEKSMSKHAREGFGRNQRRGASPEAAAAAAAARLPRSSQHIRGAHYAWYATRASLGHGTEVHCDHERSFGRWRSSPGARKGAGSPSQLKLLPLRKKISCGRKEGEPKRTTTCSVVALLVGPSVARSCF